MDGTPNILIRRARRKRGWTPEMLAEESGVSAKTIRDIEQGRVARPRERTLFKLAVALDVSVDEIDPWEVAA